MKRIVLVSQTLAMGGAERTTILLANELAKQDDCQVSLVVASASGEYGKLRPELSATVQVVDLACLQIYPFIVPFSKWLKSAQPDVVFASQTTMNIACYLAVKLASFRGRFIAREVSTPSVNLKHLRGIKKYVLQCLMRLVYGRADCLVSVSEGAAADLQRYLGRSFSNLVVVYDPVVSAALFDGAGADLDHPWFQDSRRCPVILAVGRLTEAKNYPLLLTAFAQLIQEQPAHLVILGEGEERSRLEHMIADHHLSDVVSLPGFEVNPFRYMARCDLYVMSSSWEGLPGSLIQAGALGAQVVSTDCPSGPREILADGKYGRLVPMNDSAALKCAIAESLMQVSGSQPRRVDVARFELGEVVRQYRQIIFGSDGVACKTL